eukprot:gene8477-biopygen6317
MVAHTVLALDAAGQTLASEVMAVTAATVGWAKELQPLESEETAAEESAILQFSLSHRAVVASPWQPGHEPFRSRKDEQAGGGASRACRASGRPALACFAKGDWLRDCGAAAPVELSGPPPAAQAQPARTPPPAGAGPGGGVWDGDWDGQAGCHMLPTKEVFVVTRRTFV